jgi:putative aminopeptidase FrvX
VEISGILESLCNAGGVSGDEGGLIDLFEEIAKPYLGGRQSDALGSRWYEKEHGGKNRLVMEAHADKIGLMLSHITDEGFLLFKEIGGFDKKVLPASRVIVRGRRDLPGVICSVPPHLRKKQSSFLDSLAIDIGYKKEKAADLVEIGDIIELDTAYTPLEGKRAAACALDDRAGIAAIIKCLELLGDEGSGLIPCISTQEEVGCRGAKTAVYNICPDMYICVDVCHAATPDAAKNTFKMGGGPVITVGPNVQPFMSRKLVQLAKEKEIPYQIDVDSGNTGTNAWTVQIARMGIPTSVVSIPVRYMHTPYEVVDLTDIENTSRLLAEFAKNT